MLKKLFLNNEDYSHLKSALIMLIDDEPVMLDIVQALLEEEGYQKFVSVGHSPEATSKIIETNPDILLLDLDMPEVNGFEVLTWVRHNERFKHLPVIILTASEDPTSKLKALELGATDFLSKPVDPSELALRVRNTLSAKAYIDQLANFDALTGLPNRKLFVDRLGWGIEIAKRENRSLALLDLGLDRFAQINKTLGISVGDYILQIVTERLHKVLRNCDVVGKNGVEHKMENIARTGGDEFTVLLCGVNSAEDTAIISQRLLEAIKTPITVNDDELYVTASIGIAVYPADGEDVETLIKHASSAKFFAKKQGSDGYQYYSSKLNEQSKTIMKMESDLRKALEKQEFELYYQPQVNAIDGKVTGMEALIRWVHPEKGMVSPADFIPVAEDLGVIVNIGNWVLNEACHKASELIKNAHSSFKVSVNVSPKQFIDPDFKKSVIVALDSSGLPPKNLVLEITEGMLMGDIEYVVSLLNEISDMGVSFSIDDFGTGYSSLSYLKRFPISELKIDRAFLLDVPQNNDDCSIVRAIIAMAHSLGQVVVAEGVEEVEQLDFLNLHKCDIIQGYYFSKPLNGNGIIDYIKSNS